MSNCSFQRNYFLLAFLWSTDQLREASTLQKSWVLILLKLFQGESKGGCCVCHGTEVTTGSCVTVRYRPQISQLDIVKITILVSQNPMDSEYTSVF